MLLSLFSDKKYIGQKFKEYRKKAKLTQEEIAEKSGIAEKHYGRLERGLCLPALDTFFKLVCILNIPLSEYGIEQDINNNSNRYELIKEIYTSKPYEIDAVLEILKILKNYHA